MIRNSYTQTCISMRPEKALSSAIAVDFTRAGSCIDDPTVGR
jgi:hypothetical protein